LRKIKAAVIPEQQPLLSKSERHNGIEITVDLPMTCTVTNIRSACKKKKTTRPEALPGFFERL